MGMTQRLSRDQLARAAGAAGVSADLSVMPQTISVAAGLTKPPTGRW
jgi:hypothetical protein